MSLYGWRANVKERPRTAKLDEDKVRVIRKSEKSLEELAQEYKVTTNCIRMIQARKSWKHIED